MRKLESTVDLLEAMKELHGWESDGEIARRLKVPQPTISSWRVGTRTPGDDHALKIAEVLDISPALVMAIAAGERARGKETQKIWRKLAEQLARGVVPTLAALAFASGGYTPPAKAAEQECILRKKRRGAFEATPAAL